jgi:hypothetical protein
VSPSGDVELVGLDATDVLEPAVTDQTVAEGEA